MMAVTGSRDGSPCHKGMSKPHPELMTQNAMEAGEPRRVLGGGYEAVRGAPFPVAGGRLRAQLGTDRARSRAAQPELPTEVTA